MTDLLKRDECVRQAIVSIVDTLQLMDQELSHYPFDLQKTEITQAILQRMKTYYMTQNRIKSMLQKKYATAGADFFVETVLFFLRLVLRTNKSDLAVYSERQIRPTKNSIRPDISIWRADKVVAIIECKTQLGWDRIHWEANFNERKRKLNDEFPEANAYLLVMTGSNWRGFGESEYLGQNYFCLLQDIWPVDYHSADQILTPIESLFSILLQQ